MIFVSGDLHGDIDIAEKLGKHSYMKMIEKNLTRDDYLIICGDFGLVWDFNGRTKAAEEYWLKWLTQKPYTVLWCDGNHENYDRLYSDEFPVTWWHGGKVQFIRENIIHLMRGQIYDLEGKSFFVMGGAKSHDRGKEFAHIGWWEQELPSFREYQEAMENLIAHQYQVDYIISHCAPTDIQKILNPYYQADELTNFLMKEVAAKVSYRMWYCGHYHVNRHVNDSFTCLYNHIERIKG